jgi:hypothetical protein
MEVGTNALSSVISLSLELSSVISLSLRKSC